MNSSKAGIALLLAGAGAATLAAATDLNGNGLALNGSDAMFDVTNTVISTCGLAFSDFSSHAITYLGGGSSAGVWQMYLRNQGVSPMSRALHTDEYCSPNLATIYTSPSAASAPGLTEGLLVGIDGVSVVANQTSSCSSSAPNGFGSSVAFAVTNDGTSTGGPPSSCPGCDGSNNYTFGASGSALYAGSPSFDALAVLYFGLTHDGSYNCAGPVRRSLIKNWKNVFSADCAAGDGTCSSGLTHAWRTGDLSGITDALVSILNPPNGTTTNGKGAAVAVGIGTLRGTAVNPVQKSNPFCNSADANANPATISYGGSADFQDLDPVRIACEVAADGGVVGGVCEAHKNFAQSAHPYSGDLGVVLPILLPDSPVTVAADLYPTVPCGTSCTLVGPGKNVSQYPITCPGSGSVPNQGYCFMPVIDTISNDPRCISNNLTRCFDVVGKPDGRQYNLPVIIAYSQLTGAYQKYKMAGVSYQFAIDVNGRPMTSAFYRIHAQIAAPHNVPDPASGTTGLCTQTDAISQIGCFTDSDPCSVGVVGRQAAMAYPGLGSPAVPTPEPLKALAVNGIPPFTPGGDPDLGLKNLLAAPGATPLYPLARRLYVNTIFGFANLQGGERELAQCYATNSIIGPAMFSHGFVAVPGGVQCVDYPERQPSATPAPNVQGSGNAALPGCGNATDTDACSTSPPTDTAGVTVPEASETF